MRTTAWTAPTSPARAVSCPCGRGRGEPRSHPALCHPSAASPQVGAALYATGAAQRRALTRTGECSAPVGPAGCCRPTGRAVLVRRGRGAHASGACGRGCRERGLPGASVGAGTPASAPLLPACHAWPRKGCVWGMSPRQLVRFGAGVTVPGEPWRCCLGGRASQPCSGLLAAPVPADVDECSLEYSPCSQLCSNTPGAFSCACLQGYTLWHGTICEVAGRASRGARALRGAGQCPQPGASLLTG